MRGELPVPEFFAGRRAAEWSYRPDEQRLAAAAERFRREQRIAAAAIDRLRVVLLLVDLQRDFCLPEGTLFVGGRSGRGAVEDSARIARFIYRNLGDLTEIICTLDTHYPHQIFFPSFWVDESGHAPRPHREVTAEEVRRGTLRPDPALAGWLAGGDYEWLVRQAEFYCSELEAKGKYRLYLWPPHCLLGSEGQTLVGVSQEARLFHAYARSAEAPVEIKGGHPLSENYSVLAPEVQRLHDGRPLAGRNQRLIESLLAADVLILAGQAASHCVKATAEDLLDEIAARDGALAGKVCLLADCMSPVAVADPARPGSFLFDFAPQSEQALARFAAAGMHVVDSQQPLASWPALAALSSR